MGIGLELPSEGGKAMTMKKKLRRLLMISALLIPSLSCDKDHLFDCTKSTGREVTVTRSIAGFDELYLSDNVDVILKRGNDYLVSVSAGQQLMDGIITELQGHKLYIRNENRCNWVRDFRSRYLVELTLPVALKSIYYDGAGSISCSDSLACDGFTFDCWNGSGDINLLLSTNSSHINIHLGRCLVKAEGRSDVSYVYLNDVGVIDASELSTAYTFIRNSSTGKAEIDVRKELTAEITHTGDIVYQGNPYKIDSTLTGSGRLIRK